MATDLRVLTYPPGEGESREDATETWNCPWPLAAVLRLKHEGDIFWELLGCVVMLVTLQTGVHRRYFWKPRVTQSLVASIFRPDGGLWGALVSKRHGSSVGGCFRETAGWWGAPPSFLHLPPA